MRRQIHVSLLRLLKVSNREFIMDRIKWTVKDYQRALASRGAKVSGRKQELIERLAAYERNDDFGFQPVALEADPLPHFPDITKFRTLTNSDKNLVPKIARSHVVQYVIYRQDLDAPTKVTKAIERGEKMAGSVLALSYFVEQAVDSTSTNEGTPSVFYATGIVEAEMRSKTTYNLKLVIDGQTGEVWNTHCECPAGRGPNGTCKHIISVLLALVTFAQEGTLLVQLSCTETLQTFKRPSRTHQGSPVRAESLARKAQDWDDDPRPKKYRNQPGYMDFVYNATTNFCAESGLDLAMRYAYPKEYKVDLESAEMDHDYLKEPLVTY